ncbi:MAG: flagellin [Stygiobacter sp.]
MSFSVNTNLGALQAYNALAKVNAETQKAQLRLATTKRINQVADDTSGYNVGKRLEAQNLKQKAQLNNIASAKNYLATAESALQQVNDKFNQIAAKIVDTQDPLKDKASLAADIVTLANEIESVLTSTNINGSYLLTSTGTMSTAVASQTFDIGGASFSIDIDSKLSLSSIKTSTDELKAATSTSTFTSFNTNLNTAVGKVRDALGYIGNKSQTVDAREEYLVSAIANNTATISGIFDADMAAEQLNATKGQISAQVATAMLSQMNTAPQQLLSLFR